MRIIEINISEFGSLKNKVITPDAGMNVIYGENESGKSTVLLFIKYMLYGLGRKAASNPDRERSLSWSGHTAAGSMTFEHTGSVYRIERRYIDGGREKMSIIRLDDGVEIKDEKTPGEYFLGVPREVFESSSYVGQMRSSRIDGEKTVESIKNMLTSADESVDTARILKNLDSVRVGYLHRNKSGGSLYDDEQRITDYRRRLEKAGEDALTLETNLRSLERAQNEYEVVKREIDEKDALLTQMNKISVINRFKALNRKKSERESIVKRRDELRSNELTTDFFPTYTHLAELEHASKMLKDTEQRYSAAQQIADVQGAKQYDTALAELGKRVEEQGGADKILSLIKAKQKKRRAQNGVIAALWIAQALLSASAALLFLSGLVWGLGLAAFVIPAIIFTVTCSLTKKRLSKEIKGVAEEYGASPETLEARLCDALKAIAQSREQAMRRAAVNAELENARRNLDSAREHIAELLCKTQRSVKSTCEAADAERTRLQSFMDEYDRLTRDADTLSHIIGDESEALRSYDYDELITEIAVDIDEVTPKAISEAQKSRNFLVGRKDTYERRIIALTNSVATLRASAEDPLALADALAELEKKNAEDREFYDALTLAMESIEGAGQVMSGSVTPAISKRASEIMADISADRYKVLRTSGTLGVSLDSDGFGIKSDMLSEGTKDAAYLSLRIALFEHIYGDVSSPLILDEALCQFDDIRAARMLEMLSRLSGEGMQCLCFTSHKRESEILDSAGIEYNKISL